MIGQYDHCYASAPACKEQIQLWFEYFVQHEDDNHDTLMLFYDRAKNEDMVLVLDAGITLSEVQKSWPVTSGRLKLLRTFNRFLSFESQWEVQNG
jgi:hypothetical protein